MKTRKFKKFCDDLELKMEDLLDHKNVSNNEFGNVDIIKFNSSFFGSEMLISLIENNDVVVANIIYPKFIEETIDNYRIINDYNNMIVGSNFSLIDNFVVFRQIVSYKDMSAFEVVEALSEFDQIMRDFAKNFEAENIPNLQA